MTQKKVEMTASYYPEGTTLWIIVPVGKEEYVNGRWVRRQTARKTTVRYVVWEVPSYLNSARYTPPTEPASYVLDWGSHTGEYRRSPSEVYATRAEAEVAMEEAKCTD